MSRLGFWVSPEFCAEQLISLMDSSRLIEHLIQENSSDKAAWKSKLMLTLCEYYSCISQQIALISDIVLQEPEHNEDTGKEEFFVSEKEAAIMTSLLSLMTITRNELEHKHRLSLTVH
mgnify:CR=1 FL=1